MPQKHCKKTFHPAQSQSIATARAALQFKMTSRYPSMSPAKRPKSTIVQALALSDDEEDYTEEELEEREEAAQASQRLYGNYETEAAQRLSRDMRTKFESSTKWSSEFPDKLLIT